MGLGHQGDYCPGHQWHSSVTFHWWTGPSLTPVRHSQKLGDPLDTSCNGGERSSVKNRIESNAKVNLRNAHQNRLDIKKHNVEQDGFDQTPVTGT